MPGGFEAAEHPVPGVYRSLEESADERERSKVLTIGLVEVVRGRAITMSLVREPRRLLKVRSTRRMGLAIGMHEGWKSWLVASGGRARIRAYEGQPVEHPLVALKAFGPDLEAGFAAALAAPDFLFGWNDRVEASGSVRTDGNRIEFSFDLPSISLLLHLSPADETDAALLRRPFPPVVKHAHELARASDGTPVYTETAGVPAWAEARACLATAIGARTGE